MATKRIKDITTTATSTAGDDYLAIDGATNGTRKIAASGINVFHGQGTSSSSNSAGIVPKPPTIEETGQFHILTDWGWLEAAPQTDSRLSSIAPTFEPVSGNTAAKKGLVPATSGGHTTTDDVRVFTDEGWKDLPSYLDTSSKYPAKSYAIADYCQPRLQSGTNIKTINNTSLLGSGNINVAEKETWYDFTHSTSFSAFTNNGTASYGFNITPANASDLTFDNALRIVPYFQPNSSSTLRYPLIVTYISVTTSYICIWTKSIYSSVQNTNTPSFSAGYVHFLAPFEISSSTSAM